MKRAIVIAVVVLGLAALVFLSMRAGGGEEGTRIYAEEVTRQDIRTVVKANGVVDARVSVDLSAHVVAKIENLYVEEGDEVEAGQPFLDLEKETFVAQRDDAAARLRQAEIDVQQAQVDLADARLRLERARSLSEGGIVSAQDLEAAELRARSGEITLERRREAVRQARAALTKAVDDLSKTTLYAPISGRVVELNAEEGEVVVSGMMNNPATKIATIADLSEILAEVDVDENEIVEVQVGQEVTLDVDAIEGVEYRGRVVEVGSSGFTRAGQPDVKFFRVKVLFENPDERLRPGMSVVASVHVAEHREALVVPIQSVVEREPVEAPELDDAPELASVEGGDRIDVVFVVEDGVIHQRPVETGLSTITSVEIVRGLEAGESIVTGPFRTLKELDDGEAVRIVSEPTGGSGDGDEQDEE